jgi:hypothetical protein
VRGGIGAAAWVVGAWQWWWGETSRNGGATPVLRLDGRGPDWKFHVAWKDASGNVVSALSHTVTTHH